MNKKENIIILFILLLNLSYFKFFRPLGANEVILKLIYYCFLGSAMLLSLNTFINGPITRYGGLLRLFIFSVIVSICSAYIFWAQSFIVTFIASAPFFSFFIFFFLWEQETNIDTIEKVIWVFCIIFLVCYFYALFKAPTRVFTGFGELGKGIDTSRGLYRIRLTIIGGGPLFLAYFVSLARYKTTKHIKWIVITLFLFIVIVIQLGRQAIFYSFIVSIFFILRDTSRKEKILLLIVVIPATWFSVFHNPIINNLISKTQNQYELQVNKNKEEMRVSAYKFYLFDVSPHVVTVIFGNGMYALGKSSYGNYIERHGRYRGYIPADVGYAAIYLFFGLFGLSIFIYILIKVLRQKVPERYAYAKLYIVFIMLGGITGNTLLGTIPTVSMALYILDLLDSKPKMNMVPTLDNATERNSNFLLR